MKHIVRTKETKYLVYEMHARLCSVLSNAKRLELIDLLRSGEKTAGELTFLMKLPKANVSQQMAVMKGKGILSSRREGRSVFYSLAHPGMLRAYDMLRAVLLEKLALEGVLAERLRSATEHEKKAARSRGPRPAGKVPVKRGSGL